MDGKNEVFAYKISTGQTFVVGFLAQSPTDNSTTLLPVLASDLGITQATGTFSYSGSITSLADTAAYDEFDGMARYNPWTPALQNGQFVSVPVNARGVTVTVGVFSTTAYTLEVDVWDFLAQAAGATVARDLAALEWLNLSFDFQRLGG